MNEKYDLKDKWKTFLYILFEPIVIILVVSTLVLIYLLYKEDDSTIIGILSFIISIFTGIIGGVIVKKWTDYTEERIITARGKSAVRSLKLLLLNIVGIEKRVVTYIQQLPKRNNNSKLVKNQLEEIIEKCNILEEEVIHSIENWTDIVPEANIKSQIGYISELKENQTNLESDIQSLNDEIVQYKKETGKEKEELNTQLKKKEKELDNIKSELREKENELSSSVLGRTTIGQASIFDSLNTPISSIVNIGGGIRTKICEKCGNDFIDDSFSLSENKCPRCSENRIIGK